MTLALPSVDSRLGQLRLDAVFEYYDGPVLFAARNELGYAFLASAVEKDTYLYVPVSEDRLVSVRTGIVSLEEAFGSPEVGTVFVVRTGDGGSVHEVPVADISSEWLPAAGEALGEAAHTADEYSDEKLGRWAARQHRPLTALRLDQIESARRSEFPLRRAGELMQEFQDLASVVAVEATPPTTGRQPEAALDSELALVQVAAGSVVFVVAPLLGERLMYGPSPSMERIERIVEAASAGPDSFTQAVSAFRFRRTIAHVRDFFAALSDSGTGVTLINARPSGEVTSVSVAVDRVRASLDALRLRTELPTTTLNIVGRLMALNFLRRTFAVVEAEATGGRKKPRGFSGSIEPELLPQIQGISVGGPVTYRCRILEEQEVSEFTDRPERPRYRLVGIRPLSPPSLAADT
jgi:hypothetical protein